MLFTVSFIFAFLQCVLTYNLTVSCELRRKKLAVLLFLVKFAGYGGGIYLFIYLKTFFNTSLFIRYFLPSLLF